MRAWIKIHPQFRHGGTPKAPPWEERKKNAIRKRAQEAAIRRAQAMRSDTMARVRALYSPDPADDGVMGGGVS